MRPTWDGWPGGPDVRACSQRWLQRIGRQSGRLGAGITGRASSSGREVSLGKWGGPGRWGAVGTQNGPKPGACPPGMQSRRVGADYAGNDCSHFLPRDPTDKCVGAGSRWCSRNRKESQRKQSQTTERPGGGNRGTGTTKTNFLGASSWGLTSRDREESQEKADQGRGQSGKGQSRAPRLEAKSGDETCDRAGGREPGDRSSPCGGKPARRRPGLAEERGEERAPGRTAGGGPSAARVPAQALPLGGPPPGRLEAGSERRRANSELFGRRGSSGPLSCGAPPAGC